MNLVLSATLFPAPFFVTFAFLNTVAIAYTSQVLTQTTPRFPFPVCPTSYRPLPTQAALPFGTIVVIIVIWALVTCADAARVPERERPPVL